MRHDTMQTIHAARGFGFLQDTEGVQGFFHRSALISPERFTTLKVGMQGEFESGSGPTGLRTTRLTVRPLKTFPLRSFEELAAHLYRYAAG